MEQQSGLILLVDDNEKNLIITTTVLKNRGYKCLTARNGEAGLKRAKIAQPDLILLDVMMPNMNGFEVCQRLKADEDTEQIPVIFMTVLSETEDEVRGFESGGVDYVTKPIKERELLARINAHLSIRNLQRHLQTQNQLLRQENLSRQLAEAALQEANNELEDEVNVQTLSLQKSNATLEAEVARRKQSEAEKDRLLNVIRHQSDKIQELTNWLLQMQHTERQELVNMLQKQTEQNLTTLDVNLKLVRTLVSTLDLSDSSNDNQPIISHLDNVLSVLDHTKNYTQLITTRLNKKLPENQESLTKNPLLQLTTREREVLYFVIEGKTSPQIAELLVINAKSVDSYRSRIMKKLEVDNLANLIKFAVKHGLA